MKKASELGLEVIQLEDQILLVDNNSKIIGGNWYYNSYYNIVNRRDGSVSTNKSVAGITVSKVITSTKPLEGLPLLVIEDEIETFDLELYMGSEMADVCYDYQMFQRICKNVLKKKETYKFTEENLLVIRNKFVQLLPIGDVNAWDLIKSIQKYTEWFDEYIQSLTKKELWIEATISLYKGNGTYGMEISKIKNNQIKAVWKLRE